jgi:DNA-binding XRE family transcriptional regulator
MRTPAPLRVTDYTSFPALIRALAAAYHDRHYYPMARRIGVSAGTVQQWENGMIKVPTVATLRRVAEAYTLDLGDLINLISKPPAKS